MARSAPVRPTVLLAAGVLTAALLTGCGVLDDRGATPAAPVGEQATTPAAPTPATDGTGGPQQTAESVRAGGLAVVVGDRTVLHTAPADGGGSVTTQPDGDVVVVTVAAPGPGDPAEALLAAPADGTVALQDDGSLVTLAADSTLLGGSARPTSTADGGRVTVSEAGDGLVRASASAGDLQLRVAARALQATDWGEREGGRSLAVTPTPWARTAGQAGEVAVWTELVAAVPEADTPVMRDQLVCHAFGAPDKDTWNLEPWRPDVGLLAVLAAACNPT